MYFAPAAWASISFLPPKSLLRIDQVSEARRAVLSSKTSLPSLRESCSTHSDPSFADLWLSEQILTFNARTSTSAASPMAAIPTASSPTIASCYGFRPISMLPEPRSRLRGVRDILADPSPGRSPRESKSARPLGRTSRFHHDVDRLPLVHVSG